QHAACRSGAPLRGLGLRDDAARAVVRDRGAGPCHRAAERARHRSLALAASDDARAAGRPGRLQGRGPPPVLHRRRHPCAGMLPNTTTSCSDAPPASGSYLYRVTAAMHTWTATATSGTVSVNTLTAPSLTAKPSSPSANASPSFSFTGGGGTGYECRID